jgi:hypothetical protein
MLYYAMKGELEGVSTVDLLTGTLNIDYDQCNHEKFIRGMLHFHLKAV